MTRFNKSSPSSGNLVLMMAMRAAYVGVNVGEASCDFIRLRQNTPRPLIRFCIQDVAPHVSLHSLLSHQEINVCNFNSTSRLCLTQVKCFPHAERLGCKQQHTRPLWPDIQKFKRMRAQHDGSCSLARVHRWKLPTRCTFVAETPSIYAKSGIPRQRGLAGSL